MREIKFKAIIKGMGTFEVRKIIWDLEKPHNIMGVDVIMDDSIQSLQSLFDFPDGWKKYTTLVMEML